MKIDAPKEDESYWIFPYTKLNFILAQLSLIDFMKISADETGGCHPQAREIPTGSWELKDKVVKLIIPQEVLETSPSPGS